MDAYNTENYRDKVSWEESIICVGVHLRPYSFLVIEHMRD